MAGGTQFPAGSPLGLTRHVHGSGVRLIPSASIEAGKAISGGLFGRQVSKVLSGLISFHAMGGFEQGQPPALQQLHPHRQAGQATTGFKGCTQTDCVFWLRHSGAGNFSSLSILSIICCHSGPGGGVGIGVGDGEGGGVVGDGVGGGIHE